MKKFILILLLSAFSLNGTIVSSVRAQVGIVNDPLHMASNLLGFIEGLTEAVNTTSKIVAGIKLADSMANMTKKGIDFLKKIDRQVQIGAEIASLSTNFYNTTLALEQTLEQIKRGGKLTIPEWTRVLEDYTNYLKITTQTINNMVELLSESGGIAASFFERKTIIDKEKEKLTKAKQDVDMSMLTSNLKSKHREETDKLLNSLVSYPPSLLISNCLDPEQTEESWGASVAKVLNQIELAFGPDERQTKEQAKLTLKRQFTPYANIFYGISGIIGLIAAVRIYSKINLGEPMDKLIVIFVGAVILLALLPGFINAIFF